MERKRTGGGAVGKGGVNSAPRAEDMTVRPAAEQLLMVPIAELVPYAGNARTHSPEQIGLLRRSLREFGFVAPVLIDFDNNIIAGHGRVEAARAEGMTEVPCVLVSNLSDAQRRAYILADNRLAELSGWDGERLRLEMEQLAALRFDTALIGFDMPAPPPLQFGPADMQSGHKTVEKGQSRKEQKEPSKVGYCCPNCGYFIEARGGDGNAGTEAAHGFDHSQGEKAPEQDGGGGAAEP